MSYSTDNNSDYSVANDVIILKTNKGVKNTLALLVDRIDAKFIATSRYYSSTSMNFQHITWIKNQLNFGDRVFFNIDAENLMNKVENISVMSIDSEKYSNDERYNEY